MQLREIRFLIFRKADCPGIAKIYRARALPPPSPPPSFPSSPFSPFSPSLNPSGSPPLTNKLYSQVTDKRVPDQRVILINEGVLSRRPVWVLFNRVR
jgi:hypothetical protein